METLKQVLERDPVPPRQLNPGIPRDLETIALKCLEKNPDRRYRSAQALADELERYLEQRPILARPVSRTERAWRWCRRNPAGSLAITLTLLVATVATVAYFRELNLRQQVQSREESIAGQYVKLNRAHTELSVTNEKLSAATAEAGARRIEAERQSGFAKAKSKELARTLYNADLNRIEQSARESDGERIDRLLRRHIPQSAEDEDLRGFEWYYWWRYAHRDRSALYLPTAVERVAISPDSSLFVVACEGGTAYLFDMATLERRPEVLKLPDQHWSALQFATEGTVMGAGWRGAS
jgi:serine/threonine-protein kinase